MKIAFLLLSVLLFSCSLEETLKRNREKNRKWIEDINKPKEEATPTVQEKNEEGCKPIQNKDLNIKKTFFGSDTKIVIATYTKEFAAFRDGKVGFEEDFSPSFSEEITLNEAQKNTFFHLLYGRKGRETHKNCYEPNHLVRFYKNEKEVAKIEICFGCGISYNFGINAPLCDASVSDIRLFFKEVGLKFDY